MKEYFEDDRVTILEDIQKMSKEERRIEIARLEAEVRKEKELKKKQPLSAASA